MIGRIPKDLFDRPFIGYQNGGITIFLDNFATGCSLPSFLRQFEINGLKIDRSYVDNLKLESDSRTMCEATIMMARKLNLKLKLIAQGMEIQQENEVFK